MQGPEVSGLLHLQMQLGHDLMLGVWGHRHRFATTGMDDGKVVTSWSLLYPSSTGPQDSQRYILLGRVEGHNLTNGVGAILGRQHVIPASGWSSHNGMIESSCHVFITENLAKYFMLHDNYTFEHGLLVPEAAVGPRRVIAD